MQPGDGEEWRGCVGWAVMGILGVKTGDGFDFLSIIGSIRVKHISIDSNYSLF